jgi:hypothetical protein
MERAAPSTRGSVTAWYVHSHKLSHDLLRVAPFQIVSVYFFLIACSVNPISDNYRAVMGATTHRAAAIQRKVTSTFSRSGHKGKPRVRKPSLKAVPV